MILRFLIKVKLFQNSAARAVQIISCKAVGRGGGIYADGLAHGHLYGKRSRVHPKDALQQIRDHVSAAAGAYVQRKYPVLLVCYQFHIHAAILNMQAGNQILQRFFYPAFHSRS